MRTFLLVLCACSSTKPPTAPVANTAPPQAEAPAPTPVASASAGVTARAIEVRVAKIDVQGPDVIITLGVGSDQGVGRDWHGVVLLADTEKPLADIVLVQISKHQCTARVPLTANNVSNNPRVRLTAPD